MSKFLEHIRTLVARDEVLVSMHGAALYEMRDLSKLDDPAPVTRYLDAQRELQRRLSTGLDQGQLRRNQKLPTKTAMLCRPGGARMAALCPAEGLRPKA